MAVLGLSPCFVSTHEMLPPESLKLRMSQTLPQLTLPCVQYTGNILLRLLGYVVFHIPDSDLLENSRSRPYMDSIKGRALDPRGGISLHGYFRLKEATLVGPQICSL